MKKVVSIHIRAFFKYYTFVQICVSFIPGSPVVVVSPIPGSLVVVSPVPGPLVVVSPVPGPLVVSPVPGPPVGVVVETHGCFLLSG